VDFMGELKNRTYLNAIIPIWQAKKIRQLSKDTRIPIARLAEEAYNDLLRKYGIELEEEPTD
jgi:hypothetical protein